MSDGPIDVVNAPECPRCHSKSVKSEPQKPPQRTYWRCEDCGKTGDTHEFIPVLRYQQAPRTSIPLPLVGMASLHRIIPAREVPPLPKLRKR